MGLREGLTWYVWNWLIWYKIVMALFGCYALGGFGLFFDNDGGMMTKTCLDLWDGLTVTFPAHYLSAYAPEE